MKFWTHDSQSSSSFRAQGNGNLPKMCLWSRECWIRGAGKDAFPSWRYCSCAFQTFQKLSGGSILPMQTKALLPPNLLSWNLSFIVQEILGPPHTLGGASTPGMNQSLFLIVVKATAVFTLVTGGQQKRQRQNLTLEVNDRLFDVDPKTRPYVTQSENSFCLGPRDPWVFLPAASEEKAPVVRIHSL